jgi:lipopolysaccharide cholinephosphotransferase
MTELQKRLLEMLGFFHDFCKLHSLTYYTVGGTTLGVARHQGFIPWDDDIDVGMPRDDYQRFIHLFDKNIKQQYVVETIENGYRNYCYPYAKLYDTRTTLIENTRKQFKRGIYIDIFPLDGIGNTKEEAIRNYSAIDKKKKLLTLRSVKIDNKRSMYKNLILRIVQIVPDSIVNEQEICRQIEKLCVKKDFNTCAFVGNLVGAWGQKEIMGRELFGQPKLYKFEDIMVYSQENLDGYLSQLYGDWRKLPPKERQVSHHDHILNLNKSYLE